MTQATWEECLELLQHLPALSAEARAEAIETLIRNPEPALRETALRTGAAVISDERLEAMLREDADDVLRNAGLEMLKLRGVRSVGLATRLLQDDDPDVVLQAVLVLGHVRDLRALEPLRGALYHEDVNVVQAAIEAVGRLGDHRSLPDLLPFLEGDPWLQMATIEALGELRSPAAIGALQKHLGDLMCGELAADSIARTGGAEAFEVLARHWLQFRQELETERAVGWIAHVLEGRAPGIEDADGALRERVREALVDTLEGSDDETTRRVVARALLALGPGRGDREALEQLLESDSEALVLPACLASRFDLLGTLLTRGPVGLAWALRLAARDPSSVPIEALARAFETTEWSEELARIAEPALELVRHPDLFSALAISYRRAGEDRRHFLAGLLRSQMAAGADGASEAEGLSVEENWVLRARLRASAETLYEQLLQVEDETARAALVEQVLDYEELMRRIPWLEWVEQNSEAYLMPAARVAALYGLRELLPHLRSSLSQEPTAPVVRVVGELRDPESLPALVELLEAGEPGFAPLVLEALGQIGGPEARLVLRRWLTNQRAEPRIAYRALSLCAVEEDDAIFRSAVGHADWYVRLACVEVLGRFGRPENLAALSQLAADAVGVVSQRAISCLAALDPSAGRSHRSSRRVSPDGAGSNGD